jgi:hypothetical protein
MPEFIADTVLDLSHGVTLRAVDVHGQAEYATLAPEAGRPVRDVQLLSPQEFLAEAGAPERAAAELGTAVAVSGMRSHTTIQLAELVSPPAPPPGQVRGPAEQPHLQLAVDAPIYDDEAQVVLEVDGTGHVRWHLPHGAADRHTFEIPVDQVTPDGSGSGHRGVLSFGVSKVLHVLRFPIERTAGWVAEKAVEWWENRHRKYRLCQVNPDGSTRCDADATRIAQLDGPILLLVHGTFSTAAGAFGSLFQHSSGFAEIHGEYAGRVLAFDHPTLHVTPEANVEWLRSQLPTDRQLTFDVMAHSRGGLIARQLPQDSVRKLVLLASPNAGTPLASKDRLGQLIDVCTNLFALFPDSAGAVTLQAVLEVVKQLATGALSGLDGLTSMDPANPTLARLNGNESHCQVYTIGTDYHPAPTASLAVRTLNTLADKVFGAANDLVVPTLGMSSAGKFIVEKPFRAESTISHSGYFDNPGVRQELTRCLC